MDEPRKRFAGMMSGLDIHYDLGEGHPLLGRRMPDLDLVTADGPLRVFTLLHDARPVLLNLGEPGGFDIAPWADRVQLVDADVRRRVGASGARRGRCSRRRADPARRIRRLGGRAEPSGARRRADHLVRTARRGVAQRRGPAARQRFFVSQPFSLSFWSAVTVSLPAPQSIVSRLWFFALIVSLPAPALTTLTTFAAVDRVVAVAAVDDVVAGTAGQVVVAIATGQPVVARVAGQAVVPGAAEERVGPGQAGQQITRRGADEPVVLRRALSARSRMRPCLVSGWGRFVFDHRRRTSARSHALPTPLALPSAWSRVRDVRAVVARIRHPVAVAVRGRGRRSIVVGDRHRRLRRDHRPILVAGSRVNVTSNVSSGSTVASFSSGIVTVMDTSPSANASRPPDVS